MARFSVVVALMLSTLAAAPPASACGMCSCSEEGPELLALIRDLPLNLEVPLPVRNDGETPPRLERVTGALAVPATAERAVTGLPFWRLVPARDLEPNTEYRIVGDSGVEAQFTTGSARDEHAPTLASVSASPGGNAGVCGAALGSSIELAGAEDGPAFAVWVEFEVDVDGLTQHVYRSYAFGALGLGHSELGCFGGSELVGLMDGVTYRARVRLHDAAGNSSEWLPFELPVAAEEPAGCGPAVGSGGAGGVSHEPEPGEPEPSSGAPASRTSRGCGCSLPPSNDVPLASVLLLLAGLLGRVRQRSRR